MPNHLKTKRAEQMAIFKAENPDEEEEEEEEEEDEEIVAIKLARKKTIADAALSGTHTLPVQRPEIMRRITLDIAMDKAHAKATVGAEGDDAVDVDNEEKDEDDEAFDAVLASKASDATPVSRAQKRATLRRIATTTALKRFQTSMTRGPVATEDNNLGEKLKRSSTRTMQDFSKMDIDNDTETSNFKSAGMVARAKLVQRRATKLQRRRTALVKAEHLDKAVFFEISKNKIDGAYGGYR